MQIEDELIGIDVIPTGQYVQISGREIQRVKIQREIPVGVQVRYFRSAQGWYFTFDGPEIERFAPHSSEFYSVVDAQQVEEMRKLARREVAKKYGLTHTTVETMKLRTR